MRQTPQNMKELLSRVKDKLHLKSLVIALSAIVVFTTTYMLILPAFTLDKQEAAEQGGIDVVAAETVAETADTEVKEEAPAEEQKAEEKTDANAETAKKSEDTDKAEKTEKSDVKLLTKKKTINADQAKDDNFAVSASIDAKAKVPADVKITAKELDKNSADFDYEKYKKDALNALKKDSGVEEIKNIKFYDISLESDSVDGAVEPEDKVSVKITFDNGMKVDDADNIRIVHFAEKTNGSVKAEVLDSENNNVEAKVDEKESKLTEASFETDGFSVYAVVDSGDTSGDARMTIEFYNGTKLIDSVHVKNSDELLGDRERDPSKQYVEDIIYDPGTGNITPGHIFKGWIMEKPNYTVADAKNAQTIADIRKWAAEKSITENETVKFYALVYTSMKIDYRDEDDVSLGTDNILLPLNENSSSYTVQHAYTPKDDMHNFEGWQVKTGGSNIEGYTEGQIYENGTNITISGDVTFSVNAPKGQWLVYHENGGTYIAPQFIKSGENTVRPTTEMQKVGYTFDDWYVDEACTTKFHFGSPITDRTHVYAKWNVNETSPYKVVIWTQNLDGEKWDYKEIIENLSGPTNTTINTVTQQGTGQNAYARVGNRNVQYTGFHLDHFDQNVTIKPDGTAVVNLYYTRNAYTFTFLANADHRFDRAYQGVRRSSNPLTTIYTVTRLYDQDISDIWSFTGSDGYTYPETNAVTSWMPSGSQTYTARITRMERMPAENITFTLVHTDNDTRYFHYYIETVDGATGSRTYSGRQYDLYTNLPNDFNYVYYNDDFWNLNGFTRQAITKSGNQVVNLNAGQNISWDSLNYYYGGTDNHLYFYYTRNKYPITYMDGAYFTGRGALMEDMPNRGLLDKSEEIYYDASLADYGSGGSKEYVPTYDNFVFSGWYLDKACTQPYPFETSKMPEGGITVYAKWTQVEYRVFLHPNAGTDQSLDWGSDDQEMNFRIAYGGKISAPQGLRTGYEMVGWFTDEACTSPFDEELILNETTVTENYDKTVDMTDPMDKWGNGATTNADVDRNWITKKFNLYAKWRKVIDGAKGIGVVYDANGGTNAPTDTTLYLDTAEATAQTAATPPEGKKFEYWVVQKWDPAQGKYVDTNDKIYPGDTYIVLLDNAKQVISSWENPNDPTDISPTQDATHTKIHEATYTVQLRAEYLDAEQETPTHIDWFANNGSGDSKSDSKDGKLKINEPIDIRPADTFKYPGHKFLGWARVEDEEGHPDHPELGKDNLWLIYDEATNSFKVKQEGTDVLREVSQIAADERQPYHDLYAVWETRTYNVTIEKQVGGENPDTEKNFTINYSFDDEALTGGNVSLKHQGSQKLNVAVPYGTTITLTENEPNYDKSYEAIRTTKDDGTELEEPVSISAVGEGAFKVEGDTKITLTNTKKVVDITIAKVDENGNALKGAKFDLYNVNAEGTELKVDSIDLTSVDKAVISNIASGSYRLRETKAPDGYVLLDKDVDFTVNASGSKYITLSGENANADVSGTKSDTLTVKNTAGKPLPHTGGIGTTIFYILGSLLVVGCGIVLVSRRRMGSDK